MVDTHNDRADSGRLRLHMADIGRGLSITKLAGWQLMLGLASVWVLGCSGEPGGSASQGSGFSELPRAVSVFTLRASAPASQARLTGAVEAWKSEDIGFEVAGRVSWVIEPNADIEARLPESGGAAEPQPKTVIAKLDDERYRLTVASAEATVNRFLRDKQAMETEISESIPAQIRAAQANIELAQVDFERYDQLLKQNAISRSEFDSAKAKLTNADSELATLEASLKVKQAQLLAIDSQIQQAQVQLDQANRDLDDCSLYSSFRGQVAAVHVVPGSIVGAGAKVATVQLMDPMKIELEVSACVSRRLRIRDTVRISTIDDSPSSQVAIIYTIDAVADPQTRTFTVTLLCRNGKEQKPLPSGIEVESVARTQRIFPLNTDFVDGNTDQILAEIRAIHRDEEGDFVWRVTNRRYGEASQSLSQVLEVEKLRVQRGTQTIPFLGNWNLTPIEVIGEATLDPKQDLLVGQIYTAGSATESWNGHSVLLDHDEWRLRPGELVQVDLNGQAAAYGLYVPIRAIRHESGQTFVYVVAADGDLTRAQKVEVRLVSGDSTQQAVQQGGQQLVQIEPLQDTLLDGQQIIAGGVHYIEDGELVRVADLREAVQ